MSGRVITAAPTFLTFESEEGPVSVALHNVIRFAPCRKSPQDRTFIFSRGHLHTTTVVSLPFRQVDALIQAKLSEDVT
jgi:hypothetical protein